MQGSRGEIRVIPIYALAASGEEDAVGIVVYLMIDVEAFNTSPQPRRIISAAHEPEAEVQLSLLATRAPGLLAADNIKST